MQTAVIQPSLRAILAQPFAVMGVVNVTPDSFYDGGRHAGTRAAVAHALALVHDGASVLDIGGESTRPGAAPVSEDEELGRVVPVIEAVSRECDVPISIDTTKSRVAREALAAGATWVNDISAGRFDAAMPSVVATAGCPVVLMHSRERPQTMQASPRYDNTVAEVREELLGRVAAFETAGVAREHIVLDPGIGFAKRPEDNLALLRGIQSLISTGFPLLVGTSRKSLIGAITGKPVEQRLAGSLGSVAAAFARGVKMFRVHDVAETVDMLKVMVAVERCEHEKVRA